MNKAGVVGIIVLCGALVGLLVGLFYNTGVNPTTNTEGDYDWEMAEVDPANIRDYLVELSKEPHMAGLRRDEELVDWLASEWRGLGLDEVKIESYSMLLDYPNSADPNFVRIFNATGDEIFKSHFKEEGVDHPDFVDAFNAYSRSGEVEGLPLYVNFGRVEDFTLLKEMEMEFRGKICIARYGKIFRGNKADNAGKFGCEGLIIFSDPSEVAQEGIEPEHVYPNNFWLPGTGVQRGSLSLADGDPLTPNWPSVEHAYRLDMEERKAFLPTIPVQPIGYEDAREILTRLGGDEAPDTWQGGIPGVTYYYGGEFNPENLGSKIVLRVNNIMEERNSSNVIGIIHGAVEPDRYVMLGNHRDAWGFGALDPSSGTAQLMEVVRVLSEKMKTGWRPRRTIMFLSWGAEEYSLCGSREFVEEHQVQLEERGVAYINTDVCMAGPILEPAASPTLAHLFLEATKDMYSPDGAGTYYDYWRKYEGVPEGEEFKPHVTMSPGAGSDHASFIYLSGVPVMDLTFGADRHLYPNIGGYPAYHTGFETFELVDNIYDHDFLIFRACAQLNLRLALDLAETTVLPWRLDTYADVMEEAVKDFTSNGVFDKLTELGVEYQYFNNSVFQFRGAVAEWDEYRLGLDTQDTMVARILNDQIRGFEKTLLLNPSLPNRSQYRHAVIAPSAFDAYGGSAFPGIGDLLYGYDELDDEARTARLRQLKQHVSDLMIVVQRAADFLKPVSTI